MKKTTLAIILALALAGCASKTGHQFLEKTSIQEISNKLKKGETTKDQVQAMFGDPSDVKILPNNEETWVYCYKRSALKAVNFVPCASWFGGGTNDNIRKLKILFNAENKVERFSFSNSMSETKGGLLQ